MYLNDSLSKVTGRPVYFVKKKAQSRHEDFLQVLMNILYTLRESEVSAYSDYCELTSDSLSILKLTPFSYRTCCPSM